MTAAVEEKPENSKSVKTKYHVESVEKVDTPEGMPEGNWCKYIIGSGASKIEGMKPGTIKAVTAHAELVAEDLNSRTSRVKATYAASKTTKPNQPAKPAQPAK